MDILHARVALRERTLLDVVDLTVRFCVQHGVVYLKVAALVLTPSFLVTWWVASSGGWGWGWTCALLLGALAQTPFTVLASRLVFEPSVRIRNVLGTSARALPRLVSVRLIQLFGVVFGTLFFLLPGVWVAVLFLYVNEVVVLEQAGLSTSIGRMNRLATSQFGDALMAFLFLLALHIVVVFVGDATGRALLEDLLEITAPPSILEAQGSVLSLAAFWCFIPIAATCRFFLYLNVRTRGEGWDIQTRFAAIAARAREEAIAS